jgi:hypothetical protein
VVAIFLAQTHPEVDAKIIAYIGNILRLGNPKFLLSGLLDFCLRQSDQGPPLDGSTISSTDGSFWTTPSQNLDSLLEHIR